MFYKRSSQFSDTFPVTRFRPILGEKEFSTATPVIDN
jgi:hypothetical protein